MYSSLWSSLGYTCSEAARLVRPGDRFGPLQRTELKSEQSIQHSMKTNLRWSKGWRRHDEQAQSWDDQSTVQHSFFVQWNSYPVRSHKMYKWDNSIGLVKESWLLAIKTLPMCDTPTISIMIYDHGLSLRVSVCVSRKSFTLFWSNSSAGITLLLSLHAVQRLTTDPLW